MHQLNMHPTPTISLSFHAVIIPRLARIAMANNTSRNITKRKDVVAALLDAYKNISECFMSVELLTTSLLPGLECVKRDAEEIEADKIVSQSPEIVFRLSYCGWDPPPPLPHTHTKIYVTSIVGDTLSHF